MMYDLFQQMKKQLGQADVWLEAAAAHADAKKFDPDTLLSARLAPDQFALGRQVQIVCDTAKRGASRITGKDAPVDEDNEQTLAELRTRIASTVAYLGGFTPEDFQGTDARTVTQPRWKGKVMSTHDFFVEHALPNFYFHLTHAYAILRHNGVGIGKRDYLGALSKRDA